jgi:hypothetical protein
MGQPKGEDGTGLLDAFKEMIKKLKDELTINIDNVDLKITNLTDEHKSLEDRIRELEAATTLKDNEQQKSIDFLLDEINKKMNEDTFDDAFARLHEMIEALGKG